MDHIRSYLLSVIIAALICSIVAALPGKNAAMCAVRKTLCGVFIAVTLISPLTDVRMPDLHQYLDAFHADAAEAVLLGQTMSQETADRLIKEQTAAYILDKAMDMGASLEVTVEISDVSPRVPCSVTIRGMVSPYLRRKLTDMIEQELGIQQEDQHWISTN